MQLDVTPSEWPEPLSLCSDGQIMEVRLPSSVMESDELSELSGLSPTLQLDNQALYFQKDGVTYGYRFSTLLSQILPMQTAEMPTMEDFFALLPGIANAIEESQFSGLTITQTTIGDDVGLHISASSVRAAFSLFRLASNVSADEALVAMLGKLLGAFVLPTEASVPALYADSLYDVISGVAQSLLDASFSMELDVLPACRGKKLIVDGSVLFGEAAMSISFEQGEKDFVGELVVFANQERVTAQLNGSYDEHITQFDVVLANTQNKDFAARLDYLRVKGADGATTSSVLYLPNGMIQYNQDSNATSDHLHLSVNYIDSKVIDVDWRVIQEYDGSKSYNLTYLQPGENGNNAFTLTAKEHEIALDAMTNASHANITVTGDMAAENRYEFTVSWRERNTNLSPHVLPKGLITLAITSEQVTPLDPYSVLAQLTMDDQTLMDAHMTTPEGVLMPYSAGEVTWLEQEDLMVLLTPPEPLEVPVETDTVSEAE